MLEPLSTNGTADQAPNNELFMARKLYLFAPAGPRSRGDRTGGAGQRTGGFGTDYAFLGDLDARLLGVGTPLPGRRMPSWRHAGTEAIRSGRGGASRLDRRAGGWR